MRKKSERPFTLANCEPFELDSVSKIMMICEVIGMIFASFISLSIQSHQIEMTTTSFQINHTKAQRINGYLHFVHAIFLEHSFSIALSPRPSVIQKWLFSFDLFSFFSFFLSLLPSFVRSLFFLYVVIRLSVCVALFSNFYSANIEWISLCTIVLYVSVPSE